jgi:predicted CoA-binding protein
MKPIMTQSADVEFIFKNFQTVAVVGLSPNPERDSHEVAAYMQSKGWRVIPVNPVASAQGVKILGETVYPSLTEAAHHEHIQLVDCFRKSEDIPGLVDEAITISAPALWMQLGIFHSQAAQKARAAGLRVVEDRCLLIEHRKLSQSRFSA